MEDMWFQRIDHNITVVVVKTEKRHRKHPHWMTSLILAL